MISMKGQQSAYSITTKLGCTAQVCHVPFLQEKIKYQCTTVMYYTPRYCTKIMPLMVSFRLINFSLTKVPLKNFL